MNVLPDTHAMCETMQWNEKCTFFYLTQPHGPLDGLFYTTGGDTKAEQAEKCLAQPKSTQLKLNKKGCFVWVFAHKRSMEFDSTSDMWFLVLSCTDPGVRLHDPCSSGFSIILLSPNKKWKFSFIFKCQLDSIHEVFLMHCDEKKTVRCSSGQYFGLFLAFLTIFHTESFVLLD